MGQWQTDFGAAPKDDTHFLVRRKDGLVTTAYFYWYTEEEAPGWKRIEFWCLQDAISDYPLDEDNPTLEGLAWMPMP